MWTRFYHIFFFLAAVTVSAVSSAAGSDIIVIKNATFHTITRGIVQGGVLVIRNGRITNLESDVFEAPSGGDVKVLEAAGLHVTPGLIDGFTNLGASDIEPENRDSDEATDPLTPHLRIVDAVDPENRFIPLARLKGITSVLCAPGEGNLLSGQSLMMRLSGAPLDQITLLSPAAIHGSLGELPKLRYGPKNQAPMTRMGTAALLRQTLVDAAADLRKREKTPPPARNFKLEALAPLLRRELPLVLRAQRRDDILTALRISDEFGLRLVINHGAEAYRVADELAERRIPVIVGPDLEDLMREETVRAVPDNAARLHRAGVRIAFQTGSFHRYGALLDQARAAVRAGLPAEAALRAMTLSPAEIFGAADRLGSLDPGKEADLVIFDGDPMTEEVNALVIIIAGRIVDQTI